MKEKNNYDYVGKAQPTERDECSKCGTKMTEEIPPRPTTGSNVYRPNNLAKVVNVNIVIPDNPLAYQPSFGRIAIIEEKDVILRAETLLVAAREMLNKQDRLYETVVYDEAECDGYCLLNDIDICIDELKKCRKQKIREEE